MFSSMKKKMIDQALAEQQMLVSQEKERKLHQKLRSMDPMDIQRYFAAYILMKQMEENFNMRCIKTCVNVRNDWVGDDEYACLRDCNLKVAKFISIAKENYNGVEDEIKKARIKEIGV